MKNRQGTSKNFSHPGGNLEFWKDERVKKYDYYQSLLSEKKEEVLGNIIRIILYFCRIHSVANPMLLDVGCGPGTLSARILNEVSNSTVIGVDSSKRMIETANKNLLPKYSQRFSSYVSNFNSNDFWISRIDREHDLIASSYALHYLSDQRRKTFFKEVFDHLKDNGVFVASIANSSMIPEITEMEQVFRIEFTYNKLQEANRPQSFGEFRKSFEEKDKKANINWQSPMEYLDSIKSAGFKKVDTVWHLWMKSIFVAIKSF